MSTPKSSDRTMLDFFKAVPKTKQKLSENNNNKKRKTIVESSDSSYDSTSDFCNDDETCDASLCDRNEEKNKS